MLSRPLIRAKTTCRTDEWFAVQKGRPSEHTRSTRRQWVSLNAPEYIP